MTDPLRTRPDPTAVPDRFRDQLADALSTTTTCHGDEWPTEFHYQQIDALLPVIAAEVEARVQSAANQRAAEELRAAADWLERDPEIGGAPRVTSKGTALPEHTLAHLGTTWAIESVEDRAATLGAGRRT